MKNISMILLDRAVMPRLAALVICLLLGYILWAIIYNIFFSPLRKIPGPKLWALSPLPQALMACSGKPHKRILELHQRYGDVVRTGPNSVSLCHHNAWRQAYGHLKPGELENIKDPSLFEEVGHSIIAADTENHGRQRRILAGGFSGQSMVKQEPLIKGYVDLLFERMREHSENRTPFNVVRWYNYTTFDVIGDLAFGESFGCLEKSDYHTWVAMIFQQVKEIQPLAQLRRAYPIVGVLTKPLLQTFAAKKINEHAELVEHKVSKRLALNTSRPDFIDAMIAPGSDSKQYLKAVIDEGMRIYPAAPASTPRVVHRGGATLCGTFLPEGTIFDIWQWPMYHNEKNFTSVESFIPERWLGDARFAKDHADAFQPFSVGPRSCLGKNLAYAEIRLILAKLVWNYDIALADETQKDWVKDQRQWGFWDKPPLYIRLEPRKP
ncbi:hypothetical protein PFICI_12428 [Pestalotiopsis fici W106-1]|uniref:Isotrichodermin C-15 hydroxylase n=1 Tax=Pestalotiopsis fici (strain W106-1 / CGMCC3.15140) TaxID=1229662 RepID=W3WNW3_PESFW|nr:uncharacterized protein PFICI_12428 [Pestalotiopsis fici W106-1]ETS75484.1 hypothetical protein PFICI_12428 [Pestalotiopsis fici W106-1]